MCKANWDKKKKKEIKKKTNKQTKTNIPGIL